MLRTRDLILFFISALFLFGAILYTVSRGSGSIAVIEFAETPSTPTEVTIASPVETIDRPGTIARLRDKIGTFLVTNDVTPSVPTPEEPIATTTTSEETDSEAEETTVAVALMRCAGATDGLTTAAGWPRTGVTVSNNGGVRTVTAVDELGMARTLLSLPLYPSTNAVSACLDSEIIGVTLSGSLIFNTDAISYDTTGSETLIGYARDGFPIYGQYPGETDACGGYQAGGGYRYSVAQDRNFILGCFAGTPTSFAI